MRIAVASFQHETNTFSPQLTHYDDYLKVDGWPGMLVGEQVCETLKGLNIACAGFIKAAKEQGHKVLPINWCSAEPAGFVTDHTFEKIVTFILDSLQQLTDIDAIYLDLHGAMVSQSYEDGEAELLRRIRHLVGDDLPIVASLDFHANLSPGFSEQIDVMGIYRTYPHLDMADTGKRCLALLDGYIRGDIAHQKFVQIPFLIPLSSQHTGSSPVIELYQQLEILEQTTGIHNIELALGFPPADIHDAGASFCVYGSDQQQVEAVSAALYQLFIEAESQFTDQLITTAQALEYLSEIKPAQPVVVADVQDNPGAGGSGDTTGILADLVAQKASSVVVAVLADADAAHLAHKAGVGAHINIALGGKVAVPELLPFSADYQVCALGSGNFTCIGEMYLGCDVTLGPMALLKVSNTDIYIIVSSERYACTDLAVYGHLGLSPLDFKLLVVKSTVHFRAAFEPISEHILMVESPGVHPCQLAKLDYKNLRPNVRLGPNGPLHS
jgi:microcystin degradation protein MlrC